ncbi:LysR family transcriptional regulator [Kitasatospora sp. MBT63]|uniref:LysR family transcriptional regulator n=1 Tax=Kitasatospora sp. MBT63 TaxID=1444768 RepID=UPI00068FEB27|nr:LysR family transcriptional regulator [Kitasatospora sp. MBT63]
MLDLRRLILLRDLAEHGTVTAVAELHRVTASAVSQQLKQLESETGVRLLDRDGRSVRLTAAGHALAADTEPVLAALERARARLGALAGHAAGPFHLACFTSALAPLAAPLCQALERDHPGLRVHITEAEPETSLPLLRHRRADLALVYRYGNLATPDPAGVATRVLLHDPLYAVLPAGHPAADGPAATPVPLTALAGTPWVTAAEGTACREAVLQACRAAGFSPQVRHTCTDFAAMLALAAAGGQVALVPRLALTGLPPALRARPLADPAPARTIEVAVRQGGADEPAVAACLAALDGLARTESARPEPCRTDSRTV